jgi:hypothetical protein
MLKHLIYIQEVPGLGHRWGISYQKTTTFSSDF